MLHWCGAAPVLPKLLRCLVGILGQVRISPVGQADAAIELAMPELPLSLLGYVMLHRPSYRTNEITCHTGLIRTCSC